MNNKNNTPIPQGSIPNPAAVNRLASDDLSLRKILDVISQYRWVLLITMGLVLGLTYMALNQIDDVYESEALILFEDSNGKLIPSSELVGKVALDEIYLTSQLAVLQSRELGLETIAELGLESSREFLEEDSLFPFLSDEPQRIGKDYAVKTDIGSVDVPAEAYEYYSDQLSVSLLPKTRVIALRFRSKDPQVAADVVNTLAEKYIRRGLDKRKQSTLEASLVLQDELEALKLKAETSARAVQEYKVQHGLDETVGKGFLAQQITELNTQLILARTERVEAQARYSQVQRLMRSGNGVSAIEVLDSPVVQKLREEELQTQKTIKELSLEYGVLHPKMVSARSQLASLKTSLQQEVSRIVAGVRDQVEIATARERSLSSSLDELKSKVEKADAFGIELETLEREAASNQALLETYLAKVKSSQALTGDLFHKANASLLTRGYPALDPAAPKRGALMILAGVGSFLLGLMFVFMKDSLERSADDQVLAGEANETRKHGMSASSDVGFRDPAPKPRARKQAPLNPATQRMVSAFVAPTKAKSEPPTDQLANGMVSIVGSLPYVDSGVSGEQLFSLFDGSKHSTEFIASMGSIAESFLGEEGHKSILVTSSERTAVKALIAVASARHAVDSGENVIVIDLDFASPTLHMAMGESNSLGMVDYLDGKTTLGSIIQRRNSLDLVYAGARDIAPSGYFKHDILVSVVELLANDYDKVILLSAPFIVSPDVRKFSSAVDRTIYVLPEKIRKNKKVLSEVIKTSNSRKKDAGILYVA